MSDTTNAASTWTVQNRLLKTKEWEDCHSFTSILIEEKLWQASLNYHRKMFGSTEEFQVVLKEEGGFGTVGTDFIFKGVTR